ncbi:MAG: hydroxyacylglutathione hydrolase [Wenzhouxiangellaceae bacterium]
MAVLMNPTERKFSPVPIPAFSDNYHWLLHDAGQALVVDPGDAGPVLDYLTKHQLRLSTILLTHHHADHTGGVARLLSAYPECAVWGTGDRRMPGATRAVAEGDVVDVPELGLQFKVLEVPGHTLSHIVFYNEDMLFCGDTLFSIGCGRLFEGSPSQMLQSLDKLLSLPANIRAFPAHEYTRDNIRFARQVEPDNQALLDYSAEVDQLRAAGRPSLPTTLRREQACNPFLRTREPSVIAAAQQRDPRCTALPADVFAVIRRWKDQF